MATLISYSPAIVNSTREEEKLIKINMTKTISDSSSDSDDDTQMKQFLEATDTTLLTNALYQKQNSVTETEKTPKYEEGIGGDVPHKAKSLRYLAEDDCNTGGSADFLMPETVQRHIAKKLTEIIANRVEFCETLKIYCQQKQKKHKSRVKLLRGTDCYVKPYEEFEYETKGPTKKPEIKRRKVDIEPQGDELECLKSVTVEAADIITGKDLKSWARKPERKDKIFHYKINANGVLLAKEQENEFTQQRRRNKWNEAKIKQKVR